MLHKNTLLHCVLVKPVGPACNCRCDYCFYLEKQGLFPQAKRMTDALLERVIQTCLHGGEHPVTFIWQGGEPTLAGLDFFEKAVALQKYHAPSRPVCNALQSNGLLIDAAWAAFLARERFLVGLSLDGPQDIHDLYRRTTHGGGSWRGAMTALERLQHAGAMCNVLCCISNASQTQASQLYTWFKAKGIQWLQCIPLWECDADGQPLRFSVTPELYGQFLVELFEAWKSDAQETRLSIRLFDSLAAVMAGNAAPECALAPRCGTYIAIEHDGTAYPCDFFVDPVHSLGNVFTTAPLTMLHSNKQRCFGSAKLRVHEDCISCPWRPLCHGGCLKHRMFSGDAGDNAAPRYVFCASMRRFFAHALQHSKNGVVF